MCNRPQDQLSRDVDKVARVRHEHRSHGTSFLPLRVLLKNSIEREKDRENGKNVNGKSHRRSKRRKAYNRIIWWQEIPWDEGWGSIYLHFYPLSSISPHVRPSFLPLHTAHLDTTSGLMQGFERNKGGTSYRGEIWSRYISCACFLPLFTCSCRCWQEHVPCLSLITLNLTHKDQSIREEKGLLSFVCAGGFFFDFEPHLWDFSLLERSVGKQFLFNSVSKKTKRQTGYPYFLTGTKDICWCSRSETTIIAIERKSVSGSFLHTFSISPKEKKHADWKFTPEWDMDTRTENEIYDGCSQTHRKQERAETRNEEEEKNADEWGTQEEGYPTRTENGIAGQSGQPRHTTHRNHLTQNRSTNNTHTTYHNNRTSLMALMNTTSRSSTTPARVAWVSFVCSGYIFTCPRCFARR